MALLDKLHAFTLVETIVAGILVSVISGMSLMIYLNVSASLSKTQDLVYREIIQNELDSLSAVKGKMEKLYTHSDFLQIAVVKSIYESNEEVYLLQASLLDTSGMALMSGKRLIYEPK